MAQGLTEGAVERILTGEVIDRPVLQVLGIKKMPNTSGNNVERHRLLLSDGIHTHSSAMLATQLNELVDRQEISQFCVIRVDKYMCNLIQSDRRVLIILEVSVLQTGDSVGARIGAPAPYKPGAPAGASGPQSNGPSARESDASSSEAPAVSSNRPQFNQAPPPANRPVLQSRTPSAPGARLNAPGTPSTPGGTPVRVHPINSITPYQNRWTIRARVTQKQAIRHYNNKNGPGKLFNMTLTDETGDIRATAFNDTLDKFYEMIEVNKIYYLSKASLKAADKRYNNTGHEYEMTLGRETTITLCEEEVNLPTVTFKFVPINQLDQHAANTTVDLIGILKQVGDMNAVIGKQSQKEIKKRDIHLVDDSKVQVRMTIWGQEAENFEADEHAVVAVKGAKVSDFGGRTLSALSSSQLLINPNIEEAHQLRGWYDSVGHSETYEEYRSEGGAGSGSSGSNWKTFAQVKHDSMDMASDKADYYTAKGTIVFLKKDNCLYNACPSSDCNKKVIDQANGMYRCEKCQKEYPNYKFRLILQMSLADHTDNQWVTAFQDTAESILGKSADELGNLRDQDDSAFQQVFQEASFKPFTFRMRAKMENYNDEQRLKTVCVQANTINWADYSQHLIQDIDKMMSE